MHAEARDATPGNVFPPWAGRVLFVGCANRALAARVRTRPQGEAHGIEWDPEVATAARDAFDSVQEGRPSSVQLAFSAGYLDAVVVDEWGRLPEAAESFLPGITPVLAAHGCLLFRDCDQPEQSISRLLASVGFRRYAAFEDAFAVMAVRTGYDPLSHARDLFAKGRPADGYDVLCHVPEGFFDDPELPVVVEFEKQLALLARDNTEPGEGRLERFFQAQFSFYVVVSVAPDFSQAYQCQAEFWRRLGDVGMAQRLLRCVHTAYPSDEVANVLTARAPAPYARDQAAMWQGEGVQPRVLMVLNDGRPHYGLDVLYDGLCAALGDECVVEFPWKPTLHGGSPRDAEQTYARYPCLFDRPGEPIGLDAVIERLRRGLFDCVIYGDLERTIDATAVRRIMEASTDLPLFVVDQQDDPQFNLPGVLEYLGRPAAAAYFKRELLHCVDFGPHTYPLPFAYPASRIPGELAGERTRPLFWAGHRQFGLRRLYLDRIEAVQGWDLRHGYLPEDYIRELLASRMGLSLFGVGFDTIRYWEVPAHGALLLAERVPIRIPHDFEDGRTAVLFDDLEDLQRKLAHCLAHEDEAQAIAAAGHEHLKHHHTGEARACQMLAWMQQYLEAGGS